MAGQVAYRMVGPVMAYWLLAFATTYGQLARRRGKQIATVAIARRLLARCFHLLNQLEAATTGEGQTAGCARNHRMRLQHGRPA